MTGRRLASLNTFLDALFALGFFRIMQFLPAYEDKSWQQLPYGLLSLLASQPVNLIRIVFGLLIIVYYWYRKNTLLSVVERSNGVLATLSIASVTFIYLFMYALIADPTYVGGPPTLLLQSVSLLIASLIGWIALHYAIHAGLTPPESRASVEQIARVDLSNPLTALIATALSWSGITIWTLSWFVLMPLLGWLLARGHTVASTPRKAL